MLSSILALISSGHRNQRGQIMLLVVILVGAIAGAAAIAVDLGNYMSHRRSLQNSADAIALAASLDLPSSVDALGAANDWAAANGVDPDTLTIAVIPQDIPSEPNPKVQVDIEVEHGLTFARLVGLDSKDVNVTATAIITSPAGGDGVIPLSVTEPVLAGALLGDEVVLKYDANNIEQGNTSPIRVDGPGSGNCSASDKYCSALEFGSESVVCADGADPTYCEGPSVVDTEPGNKVGATRTAINYRLDNTDSACADFEGNNGVFEDDPTTAEAGVYRIRQGCNPFLSSSYASRRVLVIPVIDELCNGSCGVTIVTFALFFLERIGDNGCTGNDCEVVGRFVKVNQNVGLLAGTFDEDSYNKFVRLVE